MLRRLGDAAQRKPSSSPSLDEWAACRHLGTRGRFRITPLYDVLSALPVIGHGDGLVAPRKVKLAMAFSGKERHYEWAKIGVRHIRETAKACGFAGHIDGILGDISSRIPALTVRLGGILPEGFPDAVATPILQGLETRGLMIDRALEQMRSKRTDGD